MQTLFDLTQNGYDILTCGTNSIILKKGDYAYKITREFSAGDIKDIKKTLDRLKEAGINVLPILSVEEVKFHSTTDFNLAVGALMDAKHTNQKWNAPYNETLQNMNEKNCYVLPMLKFDFVEGVNLFGDKRLEGLKLINKTPTLATAKVLNPVIIEKLNSNLLPNLQIAETLSSREIYKFMDDGNKILQTGLSIDNRTGDNFIYGTDAYGNRGIFFIDLGGIEKMSRGVSKGETNLFFATIDNLCKMIYVETKADLGEATNRIAKVYGKYDAALKKYLKQNPGCKTQFEEYMKRDNYYSKLQKSFGDGVSEHQPE